MENNTHTIIQMELLELVKAMQQFQNDNLPEGCHLHINLNGENSGTVYIHGIKDHAAGLQVKRLIGIEDVTKTTYDPSEPWHSMQGKLTDGFFIHFMCKGLPPMCRIETYEEEIPKSEYVVSGETVKVKRTRICCGGEK